MIGNFNLSDYIEYAVSDAWADRAIRIEDVKEFIKRLKEEVPMWISMKEFHVIDQINHLAGEKLT